MPKQSTKRKISIIVAILVVSFILLLFRDYGLLLIAILAAVVAVATAYGQQGRINPYAVGVLIGAIALWLVALLSFYLNAKVVGEFDNGGTWVSDHAPTTGLVATLKYSPMFIAAFFGYDSNTTYGSNDSEALLVLGAAVSALVIVGGLHLWKLLSSK